MYCIAACDFGSLTELEQFIDGLNNCNGLQLICSNAEAFRVVFKYQISCLQLNKWMKSLISPLVIFCSLLLVAEVFLQ